MAIERLYIENTYIPLTATLNPSITKQIADIRTPDQRKASFSKTVSIPRSKEADKIFSHIFEINAIDLTFDVNAKASVRYEADSEIIIQGYLKLNEIKVNDFQDITYECTMYSEVADFFAAIRNLYLTDIDMTDFDHSFTKEIQQKSWATEVWYNGAFTPFAYGTGYVYPLIDYGLSTNSTEFIYNQIGCAIYVTEYINRIVADAGYSIQAGGFMDTSAVIDHLIIPSSPDCYQLNTAEIGTREFAANTPLLTSTGTTTSGNLTHNDLCTKDKIRCSVEVVDTGLNYDPATGVWTVISAGTYDISAIMDVNVTFTPSTITPVKTRCEVDGFIEFWWTPQSTGVEVLAAQQPFYISKNDTSFTAGARSTSSTPTYEDKDYLNGQHWSTYPNDTSLTGRAVTPPDRYQLVTNGIPLSSGDEIRVYYRAGLYHKVNPLGYSTDFFVDAVGTYYSGNATLTIAVGSFFNKVSNTVLQEGNTLLMSKVVPQKVTQTDFLTSIFKMFNLWVDVNPLNPYELIIDTRDDYLSTTKKNIHELIDRSKDIVYIPMGSLDAKEYHFKYKDDSDYWNAKYKNDWQDTYGNRQVDVNSEFLSNTNATEIIFSPTTMVAQPNSDLVLPTIEQYDSNGAPISTKHNARILYYGGLKTTTYAWNHTNYLLGWPYVPLVDTYTTYPYAGHWDDPYNPTLDINFGLVKEVYYDDNLHTISWTNNNLVNKYHAKLLREITDENSKIVKAYVHLTPLNYVNFTFDKIYEWDYSFFRLESIEGYSPNSEETTLCTFLKIIDASTFTASTGTATGATGVQNPAQTGGNVIMSEPIPAKPAPTHKDANTSQTKNQTVEGEGNVIGARSQYIEVYGNYNRVFAETTNVKIQGDSNIVYAGLENVTLINSNNLTVTESNVTYINGILVGNMPSDVKLITASQFAELSVKTYLIDSSGGAVTLTFALAITNFVEGQTWFIKAVDVTNTVTIAITGGLIDGAASTTIATVDDGIEVQYYDGDFYIVSNKNTSGGGSGLTQQQVEGLI